MIRPTAGDPEQELRAIYQKAAHDSLHIMNIDLPLVESRINRAFASPVGSVEYKSAGRLLDEKKVLERRLTEARRIVARYKTLFVDRLSGQIV